jgi:hypothetical protein
MMKLMSSFTLTDCCLETWLSASSLKLNQTYKEVAGSLTLLMS